MVKIKDLKAKDIMGEKLPHSSPDKRVSDAIGLMRKHDLEEVPIIENDEVVGIISDNTFIDKRNLSFSTRLRHVMSQPPEVNLDDSMVDVSEMLLASGHRGVPVTSEEGSYEGFISRKDICEVIPTIDELKKTEVKDFMTPNPATIQVGENIGKARSMMKNYDVRVLPVVDKHNNLSGMIGIQDILENVARPEHRQEKGVRTGEKDSPYQKIDIGSIMSEPPITTTSNSKIQDAADKMNEHEISTLVATEGDDIKGVLTQFDLIEMITSFREADQVYVQITGLKESPGIYDQMYDLIQSYLKKMNRVLKPLVLNVHVVTHQKGGDQSKYSVRLRLSTDHGMYYAKKFDWNVMKALDEGLESLRGKVFSDKEKKLDKRKHPKYQKIISEQG